MLQARQEHTGALLLCKQKVLDLDDAGYRITGVTKKLQAHGARVRGPAVHHPACAGDEAVAALFLDTGQACQEFVGHVLAQAIFAKGRSRNIQLLCAQQGFAVRLEVLQLKTGKLHVVDLAHVVPHPAHLQPLGLWCHHAPGCQVVQRGAPQHRLLAASVHGDIAADTGSLRRRRVHRKFKTCPLRGIGHALGHHTGLGPHGGHVVVHPGQAAHFHLGHGLEFFGIDHRAAPGQRNRSAGVASATAAGNDGQAQVNATFYQARHLVFGIGCQNYKRILHAPVGRVGHVRHTREAIELDVVPGSESVQNTLGTPAQVGNLGKRCVKGAHGQLGPGQQLPHHRVALRVCFWAATLFNLTQAVVECIHQQATTLRIVQQVVLQVGVALHHPDVTQHLVEHARRASRAPLTPQLVEHIPRGLAQ